MIRTAKSLCDMGKRVLIIADSREQAQNLILQLADHSDRIDVKTPSSIGFDFETWEIRGSWRYDEILVDHFAIERRFRTMLEMLHMFDAEKFLQEGWGGR